MADLGVIGRLVRLTSPTHGGVIAGTVTDAASAPVSHLVYAVNTETLYVTTARSDPLTGNYILPTCHISGKVPHVVFERTPDGSENARVFDNVIPL